MDIKWIFSHELESPGVAAINEIRVVSVDVAVTEAASGLREDR